MYKKNYIFIIISMFLLIGAFHAQAYETEGPEMISPAPGSQLENGNVTFEWGTIPGATQYWLQVGSSYPSGSTDIYNNSTGESTSATVWLPSGKEQYYVTVHKKIDSSWSSRMFIYYPAESAAAVELTMVSPEPHSILPSTSVTFEWDDIGIIYTVKVGTEYGNVNTGDLYYGSTSDNFITIDNLPSGGRAVCVRLKTMVDGSWVIKDFIFTSTY